MNGQFAKTVHLLVVLGPLLAAGPVLTFPSAAAVTPDGWGTAVAIEPDSMDASGQEIAVDSRGNAIALWVQSGSIWANRFVVGVGWGSPTLVETSAQVASSPDVAVDEAGSAIAVWAHFDGTVHNIWASRFVVGTGWGSPALLETLGGPTAGQKIAVHRDGNGFVVWSGSDGFGVTGRIWANRFVVGAGWTGASAIDNQIGGPNSPQVAVDGAGNALAVWEQNDAIWANRFVAGAGWETATRVETSGSSVTPARSPHVAMDGGGNAVVVWPYYPDGVTADIMSNRFVVGFGWGTPNPVEGGSFTATEPQVAVEAEGDARAVWVQSDGTAPSIWSNRFRVGAGWSPVATQIEARNETAHAPKLAVDGSGNMTALWVQSDGAADSIWSNRFVVGSGWGAPALVETYDAGLAASPQVDVDSAGNALALWAQFDGLAMSVWANRFVSADTRPPSLVIVGPGDGTLTAVPIVTVSGLTEPGASLVVNGFLIAVAPDGSFSFDLALREGVNVITATATDDAGNAMTMSRTVTVDTIAPRLFLTAPVRGLTNLPTVAVTGFTEPGSALTVNGVLKVVAGDGSFATSVSLVEGPNVVTVVALDGAGNAASVVREVTRDSTPPVLVLSSPAEGATTDVASITVSGSTEPGASLAVNGVAVATRGDGTFSFDLAMRAGANGITATATDAAGNIATTSVTVTFADPVPKLEQDLEDERRELRATQLRLDGLALQASVLLFLLLAFVALNIVQFVRYRNVLGKRAATTAPRGRWDKPGTRGEGPKDDETPPTEGDSRAVQRSAGEDAGSKLDELERMRAEGSISEKEYQARREEILGGL